MAKSERFDRVPRRLLQVGDSAPVFDLRWTFEESVALAEMLVRGPVVLVFYVFDFGDY